MMTARGYRLLFFFFFLFFFDAHFPEYALCCSVFKSRDHACHVTSNRKFSCCPPHHAACRFQCPLTAYGRCGGCQCQEKLSGKSSLRLIARSQHFSGLSVFIPFARRLAALLTVPLLAKTTRVQIILSMNADVVRTHAFL